MNLRSAIPFAASLGFAAALAGCNGSFASSYHPVSAPPPKAALVPSPGGPHLLMSSDLELDQARWEAAGYAVVGNSTFFADDPVPLDRECDAARQQAAAVHADLVLVELHNYWRPTNSGVEAYHGVSWGLPDIPKTRIDATYLVRTQPNSVASSPENQP
jgi:hypothetical protein